MVCDAQILPLDNFCSDEATDMPGTESESLYDYYLTGSSASAQSYKAILRISRLKVARQHICMPAPAGQRSLHRYYSSSSSCTELALQVMKHQHCASARTSGLQSGHLSSGNGLCMQNPANHENDVRHDELVTRGKPSTFVSAGRARRTCCIPRFADIFNSWPRFSWQRAHLTSVLMNYKLVCFKRACYSDIRLRSIVITNV